MWLCGARKSAAVDPALSVLDEEGLTPLVRACLALDRAAVGRLLRAGADVNARCGSDQRAALHAALSAHKTLSEHKRGHGHRHGAEAGEAGAGAGSAAEAKVEAEARAEGAARPSEAAPPPRGLTERGEAERGGADAVRGGATVGKADGVAAKKIKVKSKAQHHESLIETLLGAGADVNLRDRNGLTPLHVAAKNGHGVSLRLMLTRGADVNARCRLVSLTPLHFACMSGHDACAIALLANGAKPLATSGDGHTALSYIESGGHVDRMPRTFAKLAHNRASLGIKTGADAQTGFGVLAAADDPINATDSSGATAVARAVRSDNRAELARLLALGADINLRDHSGWGPLHIACRFGLEQEGLLLLARGAEFVPALDGQSPLQLLGEKAEDCPELALALQKARAITLGKALGSVPRGAGGVGSTVAGRAAAAASGGGSAAFALGSPMRFSSAPATSEDRDDDGNTMLTRAARAGREAEVAKLLLEGADPNARNKDGKGPLHAACEKGSDGCVKLLLVRAPSGQERLDKRRGANVMLADKHGWTPLHVACIGDFRPVIKRLVASGADVNAPDLDGASPLHLSVLNNRRSAVAALLSRGANPNAIDHGGSSPLDYAAQWGRDAMAVALLQKGAERSPRIDALLEANASKMVMTITWLQRSERGEAMSPLPMSPMSPMSPASPGAGSSEAWPLSPPPMLADAVPDAVPTEAVAAAVAQAGREGPAMAERKDQAKAAPEAAAAEIEQASSESAPAHDNETATIKITAASSSQDSESGSGSSSRSGSGSVTDGDEDVAE